ncbi:sulfatase [Pedobacter sp.]|jgi:arylsulfatase A-like enzyme|uniref:sulfatase family protein n=1 Tax=Pedobacter sp. TaxID=1411316 RepID=UPI002CC57B71|nr:sulfatase [Pedobacter sp.]HWW40096.1 sulfatase [Pedobacter sp.]
MKKLFVLLLLFCGFETYAQQEKPNVVIIISDDHAYQAISAYGSKLMPTPGIDRIAKEGVRFDKGYVTNSICGPSRAVILTGKYSHKNGFKDNENSRFDGSQDSFIKQLGKGGYQTAWIGKWHLESEPQGFSYWQVLPDQGQYYNPDFIMQDGSRKRVEGYVSNVIEDAAENWLDKRDPSKPFCLVIGHKATHRVWLPDTADMGMFDKTTFPLPHNFYDDYQGREAAKVQDMSIAKTMIMGYDLKMFGSEGAADKDGNIKRMNAAQRAKFNRYYLPVEADLKSRNLSGRALTEWKYQHYMRDYLSTAASLDRNIKRTLDYLDKHHLAKNTIVIYLSDQGFYLGEHGWFDKRFIYEESFRTPMVMRYPGVIKPGTVSNDFVMNLDIAPTILDAAGVSIPGDMQGKSMLPVLKDKKIKGREYLYYHYYENGEHSVSPHFGIRNRRYKLIRFYKRVESWELYDLMKDPNEVHNVYGEKGYQKIMHQMKKELNKQIAQYDDLDAKKIVEKGI